MISLFFHKVAIMLFDAEGRLLLAKDTDTGLWMTIGGAIERDEKPADAAVRECREETGLLVQLTDLLGIFGGPEFRIRYPNGDVTSHVVTAFLEAWACPPPNVQQVLLNPCIHANVWPLTSWAPALGVRAQGPGFQPADRLRGVSLRG
jgi:8-oxo-dGTP pyrophosphatase MutT (NUDIX family)